MASIGLGSGVKLPVGLSCSLWTNGSVGGAVWGEDHVWSSLEVVRFLKQGTNKRKKVHGPSWDEQSRAGLGPWVPSGEQW